MRRTLSILLALLLVTEGATGIAFAATDPAGLLVSAEWLNDRLESGAEDLVILHVGPTETFADGHIPGACLMAESDFATPGSHGEGLILEMPDPSMLEAALRERGVGEETQVVVYAKDGWIVGATRLVFTLDWAGLGARTHLLDGGYKAWTAAGLDVSITEAEVASGKVEVRPRPELIVDADWIRKSSGVGQTRLVDARAGSFFDGVREDSGASGHIDGAANLPWAELLDPQTRRFLDPDALARRFAEAGVRPGDTVVGYCHIGLFATLVLFSARLLGHEVRLYDGAFQDWAQRELPVQGGP